MINIRCPGKLTPIIYLEIDARRNAVRKIDETYYWDMIHSSCNKQLDQVASRLMSTATAAAYKALTRSAFLNTKYIKIPSSPFKIFQFQIFPQSFDRHFEKLGHLWDDGHQCQVMQSQKWSTSNSSAYMDSQDVVTALWVSLRTITKMFLWQDNSKRVLQPKLLWCPPSLSKTGIRAHVTACCSAGIRPDISWRYLRPQSKTYVQPTQGPCTRLLHVS